MLPYPMMPSPDTVRCVRRTPPTLPSIVWMVRPSAFSTMPIWDGLPLPSHAKKTISPRSG